MAKSPSQDDRSYSQHGANYPVLVGQSTSVQDAIGASNSVLARVTDTADGTWDASVSVGDWVRLTAHHVWDAGGDGIALGDTVVHPFTRYGGENVSVGQVVGYRETDGSGNNLDVAARTLSAADAYGIVGGGGSYEWTGGAFTGTWGDIVGSNVVTTGPRTGFVKGSDHAGDVGTILSVTDGPSSSDVRVDLGAETNPNLSSGESWQIAGNGDSGCPLFLESTMELIGVVFATAYPASGEGRWTRVDRVTADFGVEFPSESTFNADNTTRTAHSLVTKTSIPSGATVDATVTDTATNTSYGPFSISDGVDVQWISASSDIASEEITWDFTGDGTEAGNPTVHYADVQTNAVAQPITLTASIESASAQEPAASVDAPTTASATAETAGTAEPSGAVAAATITAGVESAGVQQPDATIDAPTTAVASSESVGTQQPAASVTLTGTPITLTASSESVRVGEPQAGVNAPSVADATVASMSVQEPGGAVVLGSPADLTTAFAVTGRFDPTFAVTGTFDPTVTITATFSPDWDVSGSTTTPHND